MRGLLILVLLACLGLCGCAASFDPDEARLCRISLVTFEASDAQIHINTQRVLASTYDASEVLLISYRADLPDGRRQMHEVVCGFDPARSGVSTERLVFVEHDAQRLSDIHFWILRKYWLEKSESANDDPEPIARADHVPLVSFELAYFVQQVLNGLPLVAIYGLLASAYSLTFGLMGRINLAFGEIATLGGYAALYGIAFAAGMSVPLIVLAAVGFALVTAAIHGGVLGRLVFAPLARHSGQQALVGTIGLAVFLQEYLRLVQGNDLRWVRPLMNVPLAILRAPGFVTTLLPITLSIAALALVVAGGVLAFMRFSRFGRNWRAFSDDPKAAQLFGIDPRALYVQTFGLSCGLAGLAGAVMTLFYGGVGYSISTVLGLKALIAAILGGIGSVPGAFLGGLIIGEVEAMWSAYFQISSRDLVVYVLLALLMLFRPGGLMGFPQLSPRKV